MIEIEMEGRKEGGSASLEAIVASEKLKPSFEILKVTVLFFECTYGIQSVRTVGICFQLF